MESKARILLIDDDPGFLEIMQDLLETEHYTATCVAEPACLRSLILETRPDLVLLDYCLRGTDGGTLCRQLRSDPQTRHVPIILLSAYPQLQLPLEGIPFNVFIPKPFDLWEFLVCVEELLFNEENKVQNG